MERRERKNAVTVLAPAKLNLALDVVGLLPNGYHALDMTMQTITLYERVMLRRSAGLSLRLPGSLVQPNDKNTAIKAALAFFYYTGLLAGVDITEGCFVGDDTEAIVSAVRRSAAQADVILTTGGAGCGPEDCTPEATMEVVDRPLLGIPEGMRAHMLTLTKRAMLNRAAAGIRGKVVIVNLPGKAGAVKECLGYILPEVMHAVEVAQGIK